MLGERIAYIICCFIAVGAIILGIVEQNAGATYGNKLTGAGILVTLGLVVVYAVRVRAFKRRHSSKVTDDEESR